jgi:DNA anti-recombination protein RmuC
LVKLTEASTTLRDVSETLKTRLDAHQATVDETFKTAVDKLTSSSIVSLSKPTEQLNEYFASLSKGVESLNDTLKALGGETITIQKRGWFAGK